jgi:hypothetical protein
MRSNKVAQNVVLFQSQNALLRNVTKKAGHANVSQYMRAVGIAHIARAEGLPVPELPPELGAVRVAKASAMDAQEFARVIASSPEFGRALVRELAPLVAHEIDHMTAPHEDEHDTIRPARPSDVVPSHGARSSTHASVPPHRVGYERG